MTVDPHFESAQDEWAASLSAQGIDFVPDPLVIRIGDLFIGGRSFATRSQLDPGAVWSTIVENVDSLITFFHLLMTRERIPLIDYNITFGTSNFSELGEIAVPLHPAIYWNVKQRALDQLATFDVTRIPPSRLNEIRTSLTTGLQAVGYGWSPDAGPAFAGGREEIGSVLLGGLIFGAYAQIASADHVLQPTRQALILALTQPDQAPLWGEHQESELFRRLNDVAANDPHINVHDRELPPTVLHYVLEKAPHSTQSLLETMMRLREDDKDFIAYRIWHGKLRDAWRNGRHDPSAEAAVLQVTRELRMRFPPGKDAIDAPPLWSREIGLKAKLVAEVGAKGELEADLGKITVSLPNWIRSWLVEGVRFRSHRKVLLRMALAKQRSDNLPLALQRLWNAS
jgi:hypothetical protein